jgi:hypothetical protein
MQASKSSWAKAGMPAGLPGGFCWRFPVSVGGDGVRCDESGLVVRVVRLCGWI